MTNHENIDNLDSIKRILEVSPGSHILIVGHVDDSNIPELRRQGGEQLVESMALAAMQLSKDRAPMKSRNGRSIGKRLKPHALRPRAAAGRSRSPRRISS